MRSSSTTRLTIWGNDESLWYEVAGPALVFFFALLVFFDHAGGFGFPAIGGDEVTVVLHGASPVVHEVLIYVIFVDECLGGVVMGAYGIPAYLSLTYFMKSRTRT